MEFKIMDTRKYFDMFLGTKLCVTSKRRRKDEMCEILIFRRETLEGEKKNPENDIFVKRRSQTKQRDEEKV